MNVGVELICLNRDQELDYDSTRSLLLCLSNQSERKRPCHFRRKRVKWGGGGVNKLYMSVVFVAKQDLKDYR